MRLPVQGGPGGNVLARFASLARSKEEPPRLEREKAVRDAVSKPGVSLKAVSSKIFSFNASPYTQEELTAKMHNFELEVCGDTVLCLDYAQSGIGSNSCGPELLEKYRFNEPEFSFELALIPYCT